MLPFRAVWCCALLGAALSAGCCPWAKVDKNMAGYGGLDSAKAPNYMVACPDVLDLVIDNHPELSGPHPIGIDGRLDLEPLGRPCVEGLTVMQICEQIAQCAEVPPARVHVSMAEYHVQYVYLYGEVMGSQRAVPYQGSETVLDLLKRTGGITPEAAPREVYVVRTHACDVKRQEVFHVDLQAIVMENDQRTNVVLQPFDQIHVGATRRAGMLKCFNPCLRPFMQKLWGWLPVPQNCCNPDPQE
jgi:protein involved in polysaccharide export with SLBB domain